MICFEPKKTSCVKMSGGESEVSENVVEQFPTNKYQVATSSITEDLNNRAIEFTISSRDRDIGDFGSVSLPEPIQSWLADHYYRTYGPYRRTWITDYNIEQHLGIHELDLSSFNQWTDQNELEIVANFSKTKTFYQDMFAFQIYPSQLDQ